MRLLLAVILVLVACVARLDPNKEPSVLWPGGPRDETEPRAYLPIAVRPDSNLAVNGDFEDTSGEGGCTWWDIAGFVHRDCPQEVRPPRHWEMWWFNQEAGVCPPHRTGQPEGALFHRSLDDFRVYNGDYSFRWFTFFRCQHAGLSQKHIILRSGFYSAEMRAQMWYSSCDSEPYHVGEPLDEDCNPAPWANMRVRIGIDPWGGVSPRASTVVWSRWAETYNVWGKVVSPEVAIAAPRMVTLFVEVESDAPLKHGDFYGDGVRLWQTR